MSSPTARRFGVALTALTWLAATALCLALQRWLDPENLVLIYLVAVAWVSTRFGVAESIMTCVLSVASFDFLFVEPRYSFQVSDAQDIVTFAIMLTVGLFVSGLSHRLRAQAISASARELRSAILYALTRELADSTDRDEIIRVGALEIEHVLGRSIRVDGSPGEAAMFPVTCAGETVTSFSLDGPPLLPSQRDLLDTIVSAVAVALERIRLTEETQQARLAANAEHMKNVLLNSVSHDLRTPLTLIGGAAGALAEQHPECRPMAMTIVEETQRLDRHIRNLLDMSRLESRSLPLNLEWHSIEELVGTSLRRVASLLAKHPVTTYIPPGLALIHVDGALVEKALVNLLENAARHTPEGTEIEVRVSTPARALRIQVADRGPGFKPGMEKQIFESFSGTSWGGFGLGLAICAAVVQAHHGRTWAENRTGGGARFFLEFPALAAAPAVPHE